MKNFFDGTSIHGLPYIFGRSRKHFIIWTLLTLISLAFLLWMSINSVKMYLQNNVTTTFVYDTLSEVDFPAVSICNENLLQRKLTSNSFLKFNWLYALDLYQPSDGHNFDTVYKQNEKTCSSYAPLTWHEQNVFDQALPQFMNGTFSILLKYFYTNSDTSVLKCWWNDVNIDCNGIWLNRIDFTGNCFTFNTGKKLALEAQSEWRIFVVFAYFLSLFQANPVIGNVATCHYGSPTFFI